MVKFWGVHEEPSLISRLSGHHHFWLQTMPFPTANMLIPSNLKKPEEQFRSGTILSEALDIIWNQLRCTDSNLEHLNQIEQHLKQTINTSDRWCVFHFKYLVRMLITAVATISGNLNDILRVASLTLDLFMSKVSSSSWKNSDSIEIATIINT